ncbi:hypothetical protein ACFQX7_15905 [Luedemannella flava]
MTTWTINEPRRLPLDGAVSRLDVWLAMGRLNVVGTDGPPSVTVKAVGSKGLTVSLDDGELSVRHDIAPPSCARSSAGGSSAASGATTPR